MAKYRRRAIEVDAWFDPRVARWSVTHPDVGVGHPHVSLDSAEFERLYEPVEEEKEEHVCDGLHRCRTTNLARVDEEPSR